MWSLWKEQWQFNNGTKGGSTDCYKYITNRVSMFPLSSTQLSGEVDTLLHANLNSCHCTFHIILSSLRLRAYGWGYHLPGHTQSLTELNLMERGFFFFFLYRRGKWFMSSAINQSEPKKQLSTGTNLSWKNWKFPEETIWNRNPFLCVDNYICCKSLSYWKWWHI